MDQALEEIGGFGAYHRRIYFLLCIPVLFVGAANFSYVFIAATPQYRCVVPVCELPHYVAYNASFLPFTIPTNDDGTYKSCVRYLYLNESAQESLQNVTTHSPEPKQCTPAHFSKITVEDCPKDHVFDDSIYESTIVTEFELTCGDAWEAAMSQSIFFAGVLVGAFMWGIISDWYGRKYTILLNLILMALSGVATALVPNMTIFNITRFFFAVTSAGVFQTAFVLGLELVGAQYRELCAVLGQYVFALGEVLLGCLGLQFRKWRMLQLLISVPLAVGILYGFVVPESPRWLISRGRRDEAIAVMERIARCNGKQLPRHLLTVEEDVSREHQTSPQDERDDTQDEVFASSTQLAHQPSSVNVIDVLRTPVMCCRLTAVIFSWIIVTFVYYGMSLTSADLAPGSNSSSKPYVQFILTALVELPGYTAAWLLMRYWGRRPALVLSLVVAGLGCASAALLYSQFAVAVLNSN
ncbi:Major facilitator sugar transporter-like, partial [Trinorchestia longiramus]